MIGHGTAHVRVKAINPYSYGRQFELAKSLKRISAPVEHFLSNSKKNMQVVYLQVGAFRNKSHAEKLRKQLVAMFEAPVRISQPHAGKLYRVRIGPIRSATADKITYRLQHLGIKSNKLYGV
jgi:rare lipoprotein A